MGHRWPFIAGGVLRLGSGGAARRQASTIITTKGINTQARNTKYSVHGTVRDILTRV